MSSDNCVNATADGRLHLGAAIGSRSYVSDYASGKVSSCTSGFEVMDLALTLV